MASRREKAPVRSMRRIALVICEGQTEESYLCLLKKWYKSPVRIVAQVKGASITSQFVSKRKQELKLSPRDIVYAFLMYDMDVAEVNERLMSCQEDTVLLLSNPCFEIWPLLHVKDQTAALNSESVLRELKNSRAEWKRYNKAVFTDTQQQCLKNHVQDAVERAKKLKEFQNPSSGIYKLIELLETTTEG